MIDLAPATPTAPSTPFPAGPSPGEGQHRPESRPSPGKKISRPWFTGDLKPWQTYLFTVLATAATLAWRVALGGRLDGEPALVIFTVPIMCGAYLGGLRAGLLATVLALLAADYYLLPPLHSFGGYSKAEGWQILFFTLAGVVISGLNEVLHRARRHADLATREHQQAEFRLQRGEEFIRVQAHMLDHVGQAVIATDLTGKITYANRFAEELYGWSAAELRGRNIVEVAAAETSREAAEQILAQLRQGENWSGEILAQHRGRKRFQAFVTGTPLRDRHGEMTGIIGISEDITERKLAERRLLTSENGLRVLCNIMARGDLDFGATIQELLQAACRQLRLENGLLARVEGDRYTVEHAVSWTHAVTVGMTCPLSTRMCHAMMARGEPLAFAHGAVSEWRDHPGYRNHNFEAYLGTPLWVSGRIYGTISFTGRDPRGEKFTTGDIEFLRLIGQWIGSAVERHGWQTALQENRRWLEVAVKSNQQMLDHSLDVICNVNAAGNFTMLSAACERILGYAPDEMIGRHFLEFIHPDDHAAALAVTAALPAGENLHDHENRYVRKDGTLAPISWSATWSEADQSIFCVGRDCSARREAEEARSARQAAEQANAAKSEFLSRMSHELRTPMNAILGFAQVLETEEGLSTDQRDSVKQILRGGGHLLQLINEVLDISSIEAGRMTLSLEAISLPDLVEETVGLLRPMSREFNVRLVIPPGGSVGSHALADRHRLKQVLLNLLGNAIKYNRPGGSITVRYAPSPGPIPPPPGGSHAAAMTRLSVDDTGAGINAENLALLFHPFDRLGAERTHVEGTGLGLALSKRLVEHMGGAIGVESVVGQGTTFWIDLPVAEEEPAPEATCQPAAAAVPPVALLSAASPGEPPGSPTPAPTHTLLYIEDNPSNLRLVTRILGRRPAVRLLCAETGALGLQMAAEHRPDLILLDLHLPDAHGTQVIKRLGANPATATIPVVMLSADAVTARREEMLQAGARAFLTKPLEVRAFLAAVDKFIGAPAFHAQETRQPEPEPQPR